jgi:dihydroxyacid dehydratase/phosphogluconate dehydratase
MREKGINKGLTNYGDTAFAAYLRRSFAQSMGCSSEILDKPIVGIASSPSGFNSCHRNMPELVEAVKRGDRIRISVKNKKIDLLVPEDELKKRQSEKGFLASIPSRGYANLYHNHVLQGEKGCDFDFLVGNYGKESF